ncbi:MAG: type III pantothenate kinase [Pygmaiobacter sp.]
MVLTVDIGNSNIVLGGYVNGKLCFFTRYATELKMEADQYAVELRGLFSLHGVDTANITDVVISSVVPGITSLVAGALGRLIAAEPLFLIPGKSDTNVVVDIDNPAEIGADLLACAIAAKQRYPMPCIVVDMGTATKLTALDKNGNLCGVSIMPGVFISQEALKMRTSLLRGIELAAPKHAIGRNTAESLKSGAVFGNAAMIDGMIERFSDEMGEVASIVGTGGVARKIVACCRHKVTYDPDLLLDGLYRFYLQSKEKA